MTATTCLRLLALLLLTQGIAFAQTPVRVPQSSSIASSRSAVSSGGKFSPTGAAMTTSRARHLGDQLSGSLTRYHAISDQTLRGIQQPQALTRSLTLPKISATDPVRNVEVAIDVRRPITLEAAKGQTLRVGTVQIDPHRVGDLRVNSQLSFGNLQTRTK